MEHLITYFSDMPSWHKSVVIIGGLTIFLLIESAAPLFEMAYNRSKHTGLNLFFTLTTIVVNLGLAILMKGASDWAVANEFGILQWSGLEPLWVLIIGLPLLDLVGAWLPHFVEHKVKPLWQFHIIHHTDQHVDTTTANRHHPGESVIRVTFTTLAILIAGAPIWLVFIYQSASVLLSQFNHSNIAMPGWMDDALKLLICTPNMHRVHHHYRQPYSDSNFGNIFSVWDRIFGTYRSVDNAKLVYGVDTYMEKTEVENIAYLLKIPFAGYRNRIEYEKEEEL